MGLVFSISKVFTYKNKVLKTKSVSHLFIIFFRIVFLLIKFLNKKNIHFCYIFPTYEVILLDFFFKPFIFPEGLEDTPFTLLNSHCSGYCISFLKNVFKIFPLPLLCLECFMKLHNLGHSSKNSFCTSKAEYEWIYVTKNPLQWILSLALVNKNTLQVSKAQTSLISLLSTPF